MSIFFRLLNRFRYGCCTVTKWGRMDKLPCFVPSNKNSQLTCENIPYIYLVIILSVWTLPGLIGHEPWKPDEAYSFGLIFNIYNTGDWIVPTLAGEPFMEKPPVYYIIAALMMNVLHPLFSLPDAARMTSGIFIIITCFMIALTARHTFGKGYGRWGILIFISCLGVAVRMHQMITDTALVAGCACGLYGLLQAQRRDILGGIFTGCGATLAMMSKGLLGPGIICVSAICCYCMLSSYRTRVFITACLIASIVSTLLTLPWVIALWHRSPELLHIWLWDNNFGRFLGTNDLGPKKGHLFYLYTLPWYTFPALPLCIVFLMRQKKYFLDDGVLASLVFFIVTLLILSASSDARELYALPLLLPLSVVATGAVPLCINPSLSVYLKRFIIAIVLILAVIGVLINTPMVYSLLTDSINYIAPGYQPEIKPVLIVLSFISPLAVMTVLINADVRKTPAVLYFSGMMTIIWALVMTLGLPLLDYSKRYSDVFTPVRAHIPEGECVYSQGLGEPQRAMLQYYTGITTNRIEYYTTRSEKCYYLLLQGNVEPHHHQLEIPIWVGNRPGEDDEPYSLYKIRKELY